MRYFFFKMHYPKNTNTNSHSDLRLFIGLVQDAFNA